LAKSPHTALLELSSGAVFAPLSADKERHMQIVCTTTSGAAQVLAFLLATHLQPIRDFTIHPVLSVTPPITYTMLMTLTAAQQAQIRAMVDTAIVR